MDNKTISNWIRQTRYRAKKHHIYSDVTIEDVHQIMEIHKGNCVYCDKPADSLDCPFPLKNNAPNVPANLVPACQNCKHIKKNNDLAWMFATNKLSKEDYLRIFGLMLQLRGADLIKQYAKIALGLADDDEL